MVYITDLFFHASFTQFCRVSECCISILIDIYINQYHTFFIFWLLEEEQSAILQFVFRITSKCFIAHCFSRSTSSMLKSGLASSQFSSVSLQSQTLGWDCFRYLFFSSCMNVAGDIAAESIVSLLLQAFLDQLKNVQHMRDYAVQQSYSTAPRHEAINLIAAFSSYFHDHKLTFFFFSDGTCLQYSNGCDCVISDYLEVFSVFKGVDQSAYRNFQFILSYPDKKTYFFLKDQTYCCYDEEAQRFECGPVSVDQKWKGLEKYASRIKTAFVWVHDKATYFILTDGTYVRYSYEENKVVSEEPISMEKDWPGITSSDVQKLVAVVSWANGKTYFFFEDSTYYRFDNNKKVCDTKQPLKVAPTNWPGLNYPITLPPGTRVWTCLCSMTNSAEATTCKLCSLPISSSSNAIVSELRFSSAALWLPNSDLGLAVAEDCFWHHHQAVLRPPSLAHVFIVAATFNNTDVTESVRKWAQKAILLAKDKLVPPKLTLDKSALVALVPGSGDFSLTVRTASGIISKPKTVKYSDISSFSLEIPVHLYSKCVIPAHRTFSISTGEFDAYTNQILSCVLRVCRLKTNFLKASLASKPWTHLLLQHALSTPTDSSATEPLLEPSTSAILSVMLLRILLPNVSLRSPSLLISDNSALMKLGLLKAPVLMGFEGNAATGNISSSVVTSKDGASDDISSLQFASSDISSNLIQMLLKVIGASQFPMLTHPDIRPVLIDSVCPTTGVSSKRQIWKVAVLRDFDWIDEDDHLPCFRMAIFNECNYSTEPRIVEIFNNRTFEVVSVTTSRVAQPNCHSDQEFIQTWLELPEDSPFGPGFVPCRDCESGNWFVSQVTESVNSPKTEMSYLLAFDPAQDKSNGLLSDGDTTLTSSGSTWITAVGQQPFVNGVYAWKFILKNVMSNDTAVGIARLPLTVGLAFYQRPNTDNVWLYERSGVFHHQNRTVQRFASYSGDVTINFEYSTETGELKTSLNDAELKIIEGINLSSEVIYPYATLHMSSSSQVTTCTMVLVSAPRQEQAPLHLNNEVLLPQWDHINSIYRTLLNDFGSTTTHNVEASDSKEDSDHAPALIASPRARRGKAAFKAAASMFASFSRLQFQRTNSWAVSTAEMLGVSLANLSSLPSALALHSLEYAKMQTDDSFWAFLSRRSATVVQQLQLALGALNVLSSDGKLEITPGNLAKLNNGRGESGLVTHLARKEAYILLASSSEKADSSSSGQSQAVPFKIETLKPQQTLEMEAVVMSAPRYRSLLAPLMSFLSLVLDNSFESLVAPAFLILLQLIVKSLISVTKMLHQRECVEALLALKSGEFVTLLRKLALRKNVTVTMDSHLLFMHHNLAFFTRKLMALAQRPLPRNQQQLLIPFTSSLFSRKENLGESKAEEIKEKGLQARTASFHVFSFLLL